MVDLTRRAADPELLDEGVPEPEALGSLADLRFVNRWLGNRTRLLAAIRPHIDEARPGSSPRLLDVGCGSGDLPMWLRARTSPSLMAVGVDLKWLHLRQAPAEVRCVVADARSLPFASNTFDVVTASLFLHHFNEGEVAAVLRELFRLTRRVLVVNDLRRARVPYVFGRLVFPLLFRSRVSVADGMLSIRRAFTRIELEAAFAEAGIPATIRQTWPYRLLAVARKASFRDG
jgi:SAM-dependent methyltransferase